MAKIQDSCAHKPANLWMYADPPLCVYFCVLIWSHGYHTDNMQSWLAGWLRGDISNVYVHKPICCWWWWHTSWSMINSFGMSWHLTSNIHGLLCWAGAQLHRASCWSVAASIKCPMRGVEYLAAGAVRMAWSHAVSPPDVGGMARCHDDLISHDTLHIPPTFFLQRGLSKLNLLCVVIGRVCCPTVCVWHVVSVQVCLC